jgi:hypothetical protein
MGVLVALLISAFAVGCAAPEREKDRVPVVIREAKPGYAVVYFFRPELDKVERGARPTLTIDDRPVATLDYRTYTAVSLTPGIHRAALFAGPADSTHWNQRTEFKVNEGATYFVALWHHQNQPGATAPDYITGMYGVAGGLIFHALESWNRPPVSAAARFESVERSVGEHGLAGLRFVPPSDDSMAVR